jgi:hypothetical protein
VKTWTWVAAIGIFDAVMVTAISVESQGTSGSSSSFNESRRQRFSHNGNLEQEGQSGTFDRQGRTGNGTGRPNGAVEALTGFDNLTNGFDLQGPPFGTQTGDTVVALRSFNDNRFIFEEVETVAGGLGPTYNAQSCRECHQNVVTGGASHRSPPM